MNTAAAIAAAETRAEQAEARALAKQIELVMVRRHLSEFEAAAARRREAEAERAVQAMVARCVIRRDDTFTQHEFRSKFIADPGLIFLSVTKPFNQRVRKL